MRFCQLVLLIDVVLVCAGPASAFQNLTIATPGDRTREYEERAGFRESVRLTLTNVFKSWKSKMPTKPKLPEPANKLLLKSFNSYNLGKQGFVTTDDVASFFTSSNFKFWSESVFATHKKNSNATMYAVLREAYTERGIALVLARSVSTKAHPVGRKLQKAQFEEWYQAGKSPIKALTEIGSLQNSRTQLEKAIMNSYSHF